MAEMQGEISRLSEQMEAPKPLPDDIASTVRQDLEVLQTKLQEARQRIDTLEADKLEVGLVRGLSGLGLITSSSWKPV
jgi:hypothetical protein